MINMASGKINIKSTEMEKERLFFIIAVTAALALFSGLYSCDGKPPIEPVIVKDRLLTNSVYRLVYVFDIYAHRPLSRDYI